jgi:hypothetical protein
MNTLDASPAMTRQQFADELLMHWRLLWPLNPTERAKRIDEIAKDLQFEEELRITKREMEMA